MRLLQNRDYRDVFFALLIWLGLGLSLGWYYTFTYYGRAGWPMPLLESCAALVLYYFSILNLDTKIQAVHWMLSFPIAGFLWAISLSRTARLFDGPREAPAQLYSRLSLSMIPILLPIPVMTYIAGSTKAGFSIERMLDVALRRGGIWPDAWMTPVYVTLATVAFLWQLDIYRKIFAVRGVRAWMHILLSAIVLIVLSCGFGALAGLFSLLIG